jgi:hypothetical protein
VTTTRKKFDQLVEEYRRHEQQVADGVTAVMAGVIGCGKTLIKAKQKHPGQFGKFLHQTKNTERTAQRLMQIARKEFLAKPTNWSDLPKALSTLVALSRWSQEMLENWHAHGALEHITAAEAQKQLVEIKRGKVTQIPGQYRRHRPLPPRLEIDRLKASLGRVERTFRRLVDVGLLDGGQLETAMEHLAGLRSLLPRPIMPEPPEPEPSGAEVVPLHPPS